MNALKQIARLPLHAHHITSLEIKVTKRVHNHIDYKKILIFVLHSNFAHAMNSIVVWLKRIFTIQTVGLMVAVGSLLVAIHQVQLDSNGEPTVHWRGNLLQPNMATHTYIYTATEEQIPIAPLLAVVENPTQYTTHDVSTKYQVLSQGVEPHYSIDYKSQAGLQGMELRNIDATLPAFEQMSAPINAVHLTNNEGSIQLKLRLTYNGIETPYEATQHILLRRIAGQPLASLATADALKKGISADAAIYLYHPSQGFSPLTLSAPHATDSSTPQKQPDATTQTPPKQKQPEPAVTQPTPTQIPAVEATPAPKQKSGPHWTEVVGVIMLVIGLGVIGAFLYMPIGEAYSKLGNQIFDNGFRLDFSAMKRAFDDEFEESTAPFFGLLFGKRGLPDWLGSILYGFCILMGIVATICWVCVFALMLFGIGVGISKLF